MNTSYTVTTLRNLIGSFCLTMLLGAAVPATAQTTNKEQIVVALSNPGKPGLISVKLVGGSITVVGYSGKDVVIDATSRTGRQSNRSVPPAAAGMKRIETSNSFDLTADENNNEVSIKTNSWKNPIDLVIKVPQRFSLQVGTVQHGDITVENVAGELEVSNVNGAIQLNQVSGSAVANTVNGAIKATFKNVTAGAPMAFSTVNGQVDLTLPSSAKAGLKLKSDYGEIYSDFDLVTEKSPAKVARTNQGGMSRVTIDDWTYGKINGGGAEIMMKTLHGNIYIRKAK
ncbi:DUF4097 family beta strand repeat-containing protein [Hymenobacter volaticus]|uniref:DUF4097 family beta strand repeat-containing protein n=1 Tax=Hymenobacter volaticus TaxID=2932254 RepID=A0ABY4G2P8_9BACT|nr:DUF4097 family beta strand repeat-containing protein [Hymenobacter volaticus]UOQ65077.1 DUF4097 family beta strand repeat-containing protein [Hymenobacter volaticus]